MYSPRHYGVAFIIFAACALAGCGEKESSQPVDSNPNANSIGQSPDFFDAKWGKPIFLTETSGSWNGEFSRIDIDFKDKHAVELRYTLTDKEAQWTDDQIGACLNRHGSAWKREEYTNNEWISSEGNHASLLEKTMTITSAALSSERLRKGSKIENF